MVHEFEVTAVDSARIRGADASYEWGTVRVETKRLGLVDSALFAAATGAAVWVAGALMTIPVNSISTEEELRRRRNT